ncbi:hypothetical protein ALC57_16507, partial [Trachymyrmex cornetzi]
STSECGGSIQSDAHTFARTKNFYSSSIRLKILSRIFCGHSTLNCESLSLKPTLRLLLNVIWLQPIVLLYVLDVLDIPRPPPPYAALKITGRPCFMQNSIASSELVTGPSVPGTMGTPA